MYNCMTHFYFLEWENSIKNNHSEKTLPTFNQRYLAAPVVHDSHSPPATHLPTRKPPLFQRAVAPARRPLAV